VNRFALLAAVVLVSAAAAEPPADVPTAVRWLDAKAHDMIRAARRPMAGGVNAYPPQVGRHYDAFWLRDYAYVLEGCPDAIPDADLRAACLLFVDKLRADGAGVDCVKFDGTQVYEPGFGTVGTNPVADGGPFTVAVAWHTHRRLRDKELLARIIDPHVKALRAVPRNPETGLVHIKADGYDRAPYGFMDSVHQTGDILFCSLLLMQAERRLAKLLDAAGRPADAKSHRAAADALAPAIRRVCWDESVGLFRASTGRSREPDLWGSAFAVHLGVATDEQSRRIAQYFKDHYAEVVQRGQLRHLPAGVFWEKSLAGRGDYQNGGYWATPVGWLVDVLDRVDPPLADRTFVELVRDFQARGVHEWVNGDRTAVPNYLASATLPLAGMRAVLERRANGGR
jgi:hypothetical protein